MTGAASTERRIDETTVVLTLEKSIETSNAHEVFSAITAARARSTKFVIVDMTRLEFISSAGVGSLLGTVELFRSDGGDLILANVPASVRAILDVLDLTEYFTITGNLDEALAISNA